MQSPSNIMLSDSSFIKLTSSLFKLSYEKYETSNNLTISTSSMDSLYPYILFTKILILIWDTLGLIVNGFGIDLMWHGIEINHAVYSLVLQDLVLCWLSSLLWCILNWVWWSSSGNSILQFVGAE